MMYRDPEDPSALDAPLDDDLRALIAQADAAPTLRPSRDLWPDIAARLDLRPGTRPGARPDIPPDMRSSDDAEPSEGRVLVFRPRAQPGHEPARSRPTPRRWLAAAAVALVAVSSGATYLAMRPTDSHPVTVATSDPRTAPLPPAARSVDSVRLPAAREAEPTSARLAAEDRVPGDRGELRGETRGATRSAVRSVSRSIDATVPGAADYDREIAALRAVVLDGRSDLDSATVDVLARNLRIIDAAIAASRAALARDPRSPFLGEQLTRALGQKVDLLRTAALLPRT